MKLSEILENEDEIYKAKREADIKFSKYCLDTVKCCNCKYVQIESCYIGWLKDNNDIEI